MAIKVRQDRGVYFVSGDLDLGSAEQFRHGMEPALDSRGEVVIDLSEVTFMDSFGLRSVALLARMVGDRGVLLRYPQVPRRTHSCVSDHFSWTRRGNPYRARMTHPSSASPLRGPLERAPVLAHCQ
jgi:anti-anti-sigma factor